MRVFLFETQSFESGQEGFVILKIDSFLKFAIFSSILLAWLTSAHAQTAPYANGSRTIPSSSVTPSGMKQSFYCQKVPSTGAQVYTEIPAPVCGDQTANAKPIGICTIVADCVPITQNMNTYIDQWTKAHPRTGADAAETSALTLRAKEQAARRYYAGLSILGMNPQKDKDNQEIASADQQKAIKSFQDQHLTGTLVCKATTEKSQIDGSTQTVCPTVNHCNQEGRGPLQFTDTHKMVISNISTAEEDARNTVDGFGEELPGTEINAAGVASDSKATQ